MKTTTNYLETLENMSKGLTKRSLLKLHAHAMKMYNSGKLSKEARMSCEKVLIMYQDKINNYRK